MRIAKTLALCLVLGGLTALTAQAQSFEQKLEQKLAKPFVKNAKWITDYDEALKASKESGKLIFAYFTRSYSP